MAKEKDVETVSSETLHKSIVDISKALTSLDASGLNRKAIVVLVSHMTKLSMRDINKVLGSLSKLEQEYCK